MSTIYTAPRPELQDALFLYATTGDGASATLIRGWQTLVSTVVAEVAGDGWDEILADPDEWCTDGADRSHYVLSCDFEDGGMTITRVHEQPSAARDVVAERTRQVSVEGWTPKHDDGRSSELAAAAGCYALFADAYPNAGEPPPQWPWTESWWKPKTFREDCKRAAALLIAAMDSADRAAAKATPTT